MLRKHIGDEAFFGGLKLYLTRFAYKTAEYHDLRAVMEEITGEDLRWFFDQWYLKGGHPTLTTSYRIKNDTINLHLVQKHNFDTSFIYRLPLDVKIFSDSGISSSRILFNKRKDSFQFIVKGFQGIIPDGENALVGYKAETKTVDEWISILKISDQYLDQAAALRKLGQKKSKEEVRDVIYESLSSDKPRIRGLAIDLIDEEWLSKSPKWNKKLIEIAENDKRGANRAAAIEKLGANKSLEDYKELFMKSMEDSSYLVEENAFKIYAKIDSVGALERAKKMIFSNSYNILGTSFSIISKTKDTTFLPLFSQAIDHASGYKLLAIYSHLGRFITTMIDEVYLPRFENFKKLAASSKETEKYSGKYALNALNTELKKLDDEISKKRQKEVDDFLTDLNKKDKDED
jgi:aminopeptidase N